MQHESWVELSCAGALHWNKSGAAGRRRVNALMSWKSFLSIRICPVRIHKWCCLNMLRQIYATSAVGRVRPPFARRAALRWSSYFSNLSAKGKQQKQRRTAYGRRLFSILSGLAHHDFIPFISVLSIYPRARSARATSWILSRCFCLWAIIFFVCKFSSPRFDCVSRISARARSSCASSSSWWTPPYALWA